MPFEIAMPVGNGYADDGCLRSLWLGLIPDPAWTIETGLKGLAATVERRWGLSPGTLRRSRCRTRDVTWPRQEFMSLAASVVWPDGKVIYGRRQRYPYAQIGRFLGLDHSTILHGVAAYRRRLASGEIEACWSRRFDPQAEAATGMQEL